MYKLNEPKDDLSELVKAEKTPLSEALRGELIRVLTEGSKNDDGVLTPLVLSRVERIARTGRDLLVAASASPQNLAAMVRRKRLPWGGYGLDLTSDDAFVDGSNDNVFAPSQPAENFGMTAIREMVAAVKNVNNDPVKLVHALAVARREGLDDVARDLEAQLGAGSKASVFTGNDTVNAAMEEIAREKAREAKLGKTTEPGAGLADDGAEQDDN